ncbi:hypothetical protein FRB98_007803 [Tulasnella sp. 332]|nr:hypothetical protein FRB98_007803 [Tulasnella sp. 332]
MDDSMPAGPPTTFATTTRSAKTSASTSTSTGLAPSSHLPTISTTSMPSPTTRMIKQRRVSLPGTSMSDDIMNTTRVSTGGAGEKDLRSLSSNSGGGPAHNGWGMAFRDDFGLPTNGASPSKPPQQHFLEETGNRSGYFPSNSNSGSAGHGSNQAQSLPHQAPSSTPVTTRRRRATTVTAKTKTREFAVPADPIPPSPDLQQQSASARAPCPDIAASTTVPSAALAAQESSSSGAAASKPRKPRKRWTMEETQSLVDGCNKWGVGNWKAILNDTQFQFQGRSPVDLKDRFRTYFPDAYRTHYPNAKTHLSTRIRSFLPDGTPIFAKTRSKKRRPFSAEEDAALRRGYERYGTTWATIVKDPVFKGMERRSTDLRDRFRNAFPDLYKAAGYKPRPRAGTTSSANTESTSPTPITPLAKAKEVTGRRGRRAKSDVPGAAVLIPTTAASTSRPVSISKPKSRVSSGGRKKRSGGAATGERPIAPGEPTAADFYRPNSVQGDLDYEDEDGNDRHASDSDSGSYSSGEEEAYPEEDRYYPLTAVTPQTSDPTSPAKSVEQVLALAQAWTRELSGITMTDDEDILEDDEEDMDVDGDVMLSQSPIEDDGGIDGTEMIGVGGGGQQGYGGSTPGSTRRTSSSEAGPSSSVAGPSSPSISQTIQDLLHSTTVSTMLHSTSNNTHTQGPTSQSQHSKTADAGFAEAMAFSHNHSRQQSFLHHNTPSTASLNNSVTSADDWASTSSSHGGGYATHVNGHHVNPNSSTHHWMSNPTSPTPSEYYQHAHMTDGHFGGGSGDGAGVSNSNSRIGKSAWGPQDWLSNNPRLDHNLNVLGGNGALTSWPTPASDPHAVLDRYDLYSAVEAAHEFASEAAYGHGHHHASSHTHAYPDESLFREFTHHRYAGDLIPGSGVAVHPPTLSMHQNGIGLGGFGDGGGWSFGALGLGLAALGELDASGHRDDYASSVASGSNVGLGGLRSTLHDDDVSTGSYSTAPSGTASPTKMHMPAPAILSQHPQQTQNGSKSLDLDAMILVDSEESRPDVGVDLSQVVHGAGMERDSGTTTRDMDLQLAIPSPSGQGMEEAGTTTPTSYPASLPCPPSPLNLDRPRMPTVDFSHYRKNSYPSPARPHSRSVTQGHPIQASYRPATPMGARDTSRSFSQPPSEHRLALQRSLSYLDPITSSHAASAGLFGPFVDEDPLAYNEPLSISSLDLQYGMSSGPNIFTPLTMFTDPPTIAPARTINSALARSNALLGNDRPALTPPPTSCGLADDSLDLSALIHTSPIPSARNHQRHQSQSVTTNGERRSGIIKKRSSWDGFQFDLLSHGTTDEAAFFLDFSRSAS